MSNKEQQAANQGELSDSQLDNVAGGQEVRKLEKITVTAKRSDAEPVVKLEKVVVTAKREDIDGSGATIAAVHTNTKKN
ncbi:hypothetical protein [Usitatibacter palustris]|uniref:Uncharacterized protein n=1 Tax=Usitatibacter palustris TaxID=2732487 RepID=A0A6M4H446_9PROT|nr:hypothetical protein [Usitatibacter palustris]QJR14052.1 hypothetical protein DSM104440_00844 [Usitatibacter palustris]